MKYYPRLKIWKNKPGTNTFDGTFARSYQWYVYAIVVGDVTYVSETPPSHTTRSHVLELRASVPAGSPAFSQRVWRSISAPRGLAHEQLGLARKDVRFQIEQLERELANPRVRAKDRRLTRIAELRGQLDAIATLEAWYAARVAEAAPASMDEAIEEMEMERVAP